MSSSKNFGNIGFTGTQRGMTDKQKEQFVSILKHKTSIEVFHHGDCVGSDVEAHRMVIEHFPSTIMHIHPPTKLEKRSFCDRLDAANMVFLHPPQPYLDRNKEIVKRSELLIATPKTSGEILRSGTWATVRYAWKRGIPVVIINPDGSLRQSVI